MKIDGLPIGNNRLGKVDSAQRQPNADAVRRKPATAGSGAAIERDRLEVDGLVVEADFEPRTERLDSVTQRLAGDGYRDREVARTVAARLVEADVAAVVTGDTTGTQNVRQEKVEQADTNVTTEYYDTEAVVRETARRLAPVVGLSALFGESSGET